MVLLKDPNPKIVSLNTGVINDVLIAECKGYGALCQVSRSRWKSQNPGPGLVSDGALEHRPDLLQLPDPLAGELDVDDDWFQVRVEGEPFTEMLTYYCD